MVGAVQQEIEKNKQKINKPNTWKKNIFVLIFITFKDIKSKEALIAIVTTISHCKPENVHNL